MQPMLKNKLVKWRWLVMAMVFWMHITLIDLLLITSRGAKFLWQQNLTVKAIAVHLAIALLSTLVIWLAHRIQLIKTGRKY